MTTEPVKTEPRDLHFNSFDELLADVDSLRHRPFVQTGQWSLSMILDHLARAITTSVHGPASRLPGPIGWIARRVIARMVRRQKYFSVRIPAPKSIRPDPNASLEDAHARLIAAVEDVRRLSAPTTDSPLFGTMRTSDLQGMHLLHGAHHLSRLA